MFVAQLMTDKSGYPATEKFLTVSKNSGNQLAESPLNSGGLGSKISSSFIIHFVGLAQSCFSNLASDIASVLSFLFWVLSTDTEER